MTKEMMVINPSSLAILEPVVALAVLNSIMFFWMYATRIPAIQKMGMKLDPQKPKGEQMSMLPANVRWKADNYNHLLEQPVLFYAIAITLALLGAGNGINATLAWVYVGLRALHSIVQSTWNKIEIRFLIFFASSIVLITLISRAAIVIWALE